MVGHVTRRHGHGLTLSSVTFWLFAEALFAVLFEIKRELGRIMSDVKIAQETLDADGDALTTLAADLQQIIDSGNLSAADQTKLQNGISALTALDTLNVTPPAPAP
jgi:hypothetical protein